MTKTPRDSHRRSPPSPLSSPLPRLTTLLPCTALALCACASGPNSSVSGLRSVGEFADLELTYKASVSTLVWDATQLKFEELSDAEEFESFVRIETRTAVLTHAEVAALLGSERGGAWSIKTSRQRAQAWFDRVHETTQQERRALTLAPGQQNYVTVASQKAFIESFDIKGSSVQLVADPVIAVACEGVVLFATGTPLEDMSGVRIEAALERHDLEDPMATLEVELPWGVAPVEIQRPVTTHQRAEVTTELTPKEAVVLAIPRSGDPEHMDVVLLTAKTVTGNKSPDEPQE